MWNMERTLSLIEDMRNNPCLWDLSLVDYKNRPKKTVIYANLSKKFSAPAIDLEKKVQSLKSQFRRQHKKIKENEHKTGAVAKGKCNWFGYTPLLFLLTGPAPPDSDDGYGNERSSIYDSDGIKIEFDTSDSFMEHEESVTGASDIEYSIDSQSVTTDKTNNKSTSKQDADKVGDGTLNCMKTLIDVVTKRDEFSVYGEYIADKLRGSGRSNLEVHIAQHHIDTVVFNLVMGVYGRGATGGAGMTNFDSSTGLPNSAIKEEKE